MNPSALLTYMGSLVGIITVTQGMLCTLLPPLLQDLLLQLCDRLRECFSKYHFVDIPEIDEFFLPNELYGAVKLHLSVNAKSYMQKANSVTLCRTLNSAELTWSPVQSACIPMTFQGVEVWWEHRTAIHQLVPHSWGWHPLEENKNRHTYTLKVHKSDKAHVVTPYMEHILKQAQEIKHNNRQRQLYTNGNGGGGYLDVYPESTWNSVPFTHPSTFETLAMDPVRKAQIQADLQAFACGQEFYKKTGRAWKRGYLLHGPPGTGKSSLIGAMANYLRYDVYDLELTQVSSNGDLRKMLLRTTSKSIIVIEDIDCSLDLANNRGKKSPSSSSMKSLNSDVIDNEKHGRDLSSMTLSGLLNFTDGLWSCCGEERIFVFTTNHVEDLDPALLRPGRMDMHILMSYCTFPAFEILALNYLHMDDHPLFPTVKEIIEEAHITPAEVSEVFMRNKDAPNKAMDELLAALKIVKARPCRPIPSKRAVTDKSSDDDVKEVKKGVDDSDKEKSTSSVGKPGYPNCPCRKKMRSICEGKYEQKKESTSVEKDEDETCISEVDDTGGCIHRDELPQNIRKVEKVD